MSHRACVIWPLPALLAALALPAAALGPLNDTGIQFCGAADNGNGPCDGSQPAGQDAHYGRDAQAAAGALTKIGGGGAGFDFTKIANDGRELPESAALGPNPGDWACTRDNVTGLLWEVKTDDNGLRDKDWRYTWYDPASPDGNPGAAGTTSTCNNILGGQPCNTANYVSAVRAARLCGASDWRMAEVRELVGIVDAGRYNPAIDPTYFINTRNSYVWSGSPIASYSYLARAVDFSYGKPGEEYRISSNGVRLVHARP